MKSLEEFISQSILTFNTNNADTDTDTDTLIEFQYCFDQIMHMRCAVACSPNVQNIHMKNVFLHDRISKSYANKRRIKIK